MNLGLKSLGTDQIELRLDQEMNVYEKLLLVHVVTALDYVNQGRLCIRSKTGQRSHHHVLVNPYLFRRSCRNPV